MFYDGITIRIRSEHEHEHEHESSESESDDEQGRVLEAFLTRQKDLDRKLDATRDPNTRQYNGKASIKKLKEYLKEANDCFEQYEEVDDGLSTPDYLMLSHQRRLDGVEPSDPAPSQLKVLAWGGVKIAKITLAEAYEARPSAGQNMEEAIKLYESLVDLALRARIQIWESD